MNFVSNFILKIRLWHMCFPVNFVIFLRTHLLYRIPLDDCYWLKYFCKNISIFDVIFSVFDLICKERVNKSSSLRHRSSHWTCSMKIAVYKKYCKIHRKTPVPESFFK